MSGKNKKQKSTRTSSTKETDSSKQLHSKKVADDNGENQGAYEDNHNHSKNNPGIPITPARHDQGNSNPTSSNTLVSNQAPPIQSVVNVPHTLAGTDELSTLATIPHQDLPSSETVKQFTTMHVSLWLSITLKELQTPCWIGNEKKIPCVSLF